MNRIELNAGQFSEIDDEDYERVNQFKWYAYKDGNTSYAARHVTVNGRRTTQRMHQFIMGDNPLKLQIDHRDGNGLNNHKSNLRFCTSRENGRNRISLRISSSTYKGVYWHKIMGKWVAHIVINGRQTHLGLFELEEDAAKAYDTACIKYFGDFAHPNFLQTTSE